MNANELADKLKQAYEAITAEYAGFGELLEAETMLRNLQAENDSLKMGFADFGTSDSELAETRAMANRMFLRISELQAEIESLKKEAALQRLSDFTQESESFDRTASHMAGEYVSYDEPVAWMRTNKQWRKEVSWVEKEGFEIPLYTNPAKTLSIEEIHGVWAAGEYYELDKDGQVDVINFTEFAYAILRKAQYK